ncbi:preprotein translocase subunit SecG [Rubritalea spongiae]|uniref:Protein-export membrane protein SecG n=1 Tax=Rubritalea spongiae TaxID=430797 RepID=A0ABW5E0Y1_9BACT
MNSMILAVSGVTIAINLLLVILVALSLLLCLVVLMQRPKQEGLGAAFGGGMTDQAFGAQTTDVLQKGTAYLGTAFFAVTLALSVLVSAQNSGARLDESSLKQTEEQVASEENAAELAEVVAAVEEEVPAEEVAEEVSIAAEDVQESVEDVKEAVTEQVSEGAAAVEEKAEELSAEVDEAKQ